MAKRKTDDEYHDLPDDKFADRRDDLTLADDKGTEPDGSGGVHSAVEPDPEPVKAKDKGWFPESPSAKLHDDGTDGRVAHEPVFSAAEREDADAGVLSKSTKWWHGQTEGVPNKEPEGFKG